MNTTTCRRIAAHYIYSRRSFLPRGIVSFSDDGTVTDICEADSLDYEAGVEFYNGILIPDMVNAHCHLELSAMKGKIAKGGQFTGFMRGMTQYRPGIPDVEWLNAAAAGDADMWREGIGAVGDVCNDPVTFDLKSHSNIGYTSFLELFGLQHSSADHIRPLEGAALRAAIRHSVTPHAPYSLNEAAFADTVGCGDGDVPLSVHFMESAAEQELFHGGGPMYKWYTQRGFSFDFTQYGSPAERIIAQIPGDRKIMLIHNCMVTEEIVDMMTEHFGKNVSWVLCPRSNMYISGIMPPYEMLMRKGVRVAVGTDSLASNDSLSLVEELKLLRGVALENLLDWATIGGAEALNMRDTYGGFEVGRRSGAVLLSAIDWGKMSLTSGSKARRIL